MSERRCDKCEWWQRYSPEEVLIGKPKHQPEGVCRRFPPQRAALGSVYTGGYSSRQPSSGEDDWCGEFSPANAREVQEP